MLFFVPLAHPFLSLIFQCSLPTVYFRHKEILLISGMLHTLKEKNMYHLAASLKYLNLKVLTAHLH